MATDPSQSSTGAGSSLSPKEERRLGQSLNLQEKHLGALKGKIDYRQSRGIGTSTIPQLQAAYDRQLAEYQARVSQLSPEEYAAAKRAAPKNYFSASYNPGNPAPPGSPQNPTGVNSMYAPRNPSGVGVTGTRVSPGVVQDRAGNFIITSSLRPGVYGSSTNPLIVTMGRRSVASQVTALNTNNQVVRGNPRSSLPTRESRDSYLARTNQANYEDTRGNIYKKQYQSLVNDNSISVGTNNRSNNLGLSDVPLNQTLSFRGAEAAAKGAVDLVLSPIIGAGKVNAFNFLENPLANPFYSDKFLGAKGLLFSNPSKELSFLQPGGLIRDKDVITFTVTAASYPIGAAFPKTAIAVGLGTAGANLIANPTAYNVGQGLAIATLSVLPGEKKLIEQRFSGLSFDTVGSFRDPVAQAIKVAGSGKVEAPGVAQQSFTLTTIQKELPYNKAVFEELRAQEPDFLVVRSNVKSGVVADSGQFGTLTDIQQPLVFRNVFKQTGEPVLSTIPGAFPSGPRAEPQFGFPFTDLPRFTQPVRLPRVTEVPQGTRVDLQVLKPEEFFGRQDAFRNQQERVASNVQATAQNPTGYLTPDLFLEKFTTRAQVAEGTEATRLGADLFTPGDNLRLPSPRIKSEARASDVSTELANIEGQNFVGRTVTSNIRFDFPNAKGVPSFEFFQSGRGDIATAIFRPKDTPLSVLDASGKVPKPNELNTPPNLEVEFDLQGNPVKRAGGRPQSDPTKSYYQFKVDRNIRTSSNLFQPEKFTELHFVEVDNPSFKSATDVAEAQAKVRQKILEEAQQGAKATTIKSQSARQTLFSETVLEEPELTPLVTGETGNPLLSVTVEETPNPILLPPIPDLNETAPINDTNPITSPPDLTPPTVEPILEQPITTKSFLTLPPARPVQVPGSLPRVVLNNQSNLRNENFTRSFSKNFLNNRQSNNLTNRSNSIQQNVQRVSSTLRQQQVFLTRVLGGGASDPLAPLFNTQRSKKKRSTNRGQSSRAFLFTPTFAAADLGIEGNPFKDVFRTNLAIRPVKPRRGKR